MINIIRSAVVLVVLLLAVTVQAQDIPTNDGWVTDLGGFLTPQQETTLEHLMESYKRGSGHEIALLTVPDLGGRSLEGYALEVARQWRIGQQEENNGALLLVARAERKVRIEVGRGLEGTITDAISGRIIRGAIAPEFKKGRLYEGLRAGVEAMHAAAGGEYAKIPKEKKGRSGGGMGLLPMIIMIIIFSRLFRRGRGGRGGRGGGLLGGLFLGSMLMATSHENACWGNDVKYKSSTEIYVTAGSGRCNGTIWENAAETTLDLSSVLPAGTDFVYIYVDDSTSSYPTPTFIGSTTEPAWSNSLIGWYNGYDRCIGAVWCDSVGDIVQFDSNSAGEYITHDILATPLTNGNPDSTYQSLETTAYIPKIATGVYVFASNSDTGGAVSVAVSSYENNNSRVLTYGKDEALIVVGWVPLTRNASRDLRWYGHDNDDNTFNIRIYGFRIER